MKHKAGDQRRHLPREIPRNDEHLQSYRELPRAPPDSNSIDCLWLCSAVSLLRLNKEKQAGNTTRSSPQNAGKPTGRATVLLFFFSKHEAHIPNLFGSEILLSRQTLCTEKRALGPWQPTSVRRRVLIAILDNIRENLTWEIAINAACKAPLVQCARASVPRLFPVRDSCSLFFRFHYFCSCPSLFINVPRDTLFP